jgi:hypothetical protein
MKKILFIMFLLPGIGFGQIIGRTMDQLYSTNKSLEVKTKTSETLWMLDGEYNFVMNFSNDTCISYGLEIEFRGDLYNHTYIKLHDCGQGDLKNRNLPYSKQSRFCWIYQCNDTKFFLWDCDMYGKDGSKAFIYVMK